jgi:hypothetical protein
MNDEDFLALEDRLRTWASVLGAPEIMDDRFYRIRPAPEAADRLMSPRERVIAQLEAFDRLLSLHDARVYRQTMEKIGTLLRRSPARPERPFNIPEHAVIVLPRRSGEGEEFFDLRDLSDLAETRAQLRAFMTRLQEQ